MILLRSRFSLSLAQAPRWNFWTPKSFDHKANTSDGKSKRQKETKQVMSILLYDDSLKDGYANDVMAGT